MGWWKKKKPQSVFEKQRLDLSRERGAKLLEDIIECCDGKSNPIKFFSADQIIKATNNFSESNLISELNHPASKWWYLGKIDNHPMIFFNNGSNSYRRRGYCRDIAISSMVSGHKNFLKLLGCCLEFEEPVIVYDFVEKLSFLDLEMEVSWKKRIKIAEDIATVLAYLHTAFPRPFLYRVMRLGKIFLDENGVARLSDFSYCISIPQGETFVQVDKISGAYGFMDDNYMRTGTVSEKTDVFAIGILMQNLLTGEERFDELCEKRKEDDDDDSQIMPEMNVSRRKVLRWLSKSTEKRRMDEIADPKMLENMDEVAEEEFYQMKAFLTLSMRCIGLKGEVPHMVEVTKELKNIQRSHRNVSSSFSPSCKTKIDSA